MGLSAVDDDFSGLVSIFLLLLLLDPFVVSLTVLDWFADDLLLIDILVMIYHCGRGACMRIGSCRVEAPEFPAGFLV